jgi:hypothetical protein
MENRSKPTFAKPTEIIAIIELLRKHCRKNGDGFAEYDAEWSDRAIARQIGPHLTGYHVKRWREELFGQLAERRAPATPPDVMHLLMRIEAMETRLKWLEHQIGGPEKLKEQIALFKS